MIMARGVSWHVWERLFGVAMSGCSLFLKRWICGSNTICFSLDGFDNSIIGRAAIVHEGLDAGYLNGNATWQSPLILLPSFFSLV